MFTDCYAPPLIGGGIKRCFDVCLSRTSVLILEQRGLGRLKIGREVAHVTRDSDTTFKVKGQLVGGGGMAASRTACSYSVDISVSSRVSK